MFHFTQLWANSPQCVGKLLLVYMQCTCLSSKARMRVDKRYTIVLEEAPDRACAGVANITVTTHSLLVLLAYYACY
jgi:hypothetical protein